MHVIAEKGNLGLHIAEHIKNPVLCLTLAKCTF